jgi:hypothetical protein
VAVLTLHSLHWSSWWWVPTNCKLKCDIGLSQNEGYPIPHLTDKACGYWVFQMFRIPNYFQHSHIYTGYLYRWELLAHHLYGVIRGQIGINTFVCLQPLGDGVGAGWIFWSVREVFFVDTWTQVLVPSGFFEFPTWSERMIHWKEWTCLSHERMRLGEQGMFGYCHLDVLCALSNIYIYIICNCVYIYIIIYIYLQLHIYIFISTHTVYICIYIIKCMFVNSDEPNKPVPLR